MGKIKTALLLLLVSSGVFCLSANVYAAGGTSHMFMTEKAIDQVQDATLKSILQEYKDVTMWASWFPDSGYAGDNKYGEYSHWRPFFNGYIDYIRSLGPDHPDYRYLVAHLMGAMAHGIEDQTYDHLFIAKGRQEEATSSLAGDSDTDMDFIVMWDYSRNTVMLAEQVGVDSDVFTPIDHLVNVYQNLGKDYDDISGQLTSGQGWLSLANIGEKAAFVLAYPALKLKYGWVDENYYDAPGGIVHSAEIAAAYLDEVWKQVNGDFELTVVATWPKPNTEIGSTYSGTVDSTIAVVFDQKYQKSSITNDTFYVEDADGNRVDGSFVWCYTSSMVRFEPTHDLLPGSTYTVTLTTGIKEHFTNEPLQSDYVFTFTTGSCFKPCRDGYADDGDVCRKDVQIIAKSSYGRGVGSIPNSCPPGKEYDAGLCYNECDSGYDGVGPVCWQSCPSGYSDHGATCYENFFSWYFKSSYGRGVGTVPNTCGEQEYDAGLCYDQCESGYTGVGPVCWGDCPSGFNDDGAFCRKEEDVYAKEPCDIPATVQGSWANSGGKSDTAVSNPVYALTISSAKTVTIDLMSNTDAYLYLLNNSGSILASDDDSGDSVNSRITYTLSAGSYRVVAATYSSGQSGSFTLNTTDGSLTLMPRVSGSWSGSGGRSTTSSGNPHYSLDISSGATVTINLMSATDTYLYLLNSSGSVITSDDDGGDGYNSRIAYSLSAGTYEIVAATYSSGSSGIFTLEASLGNLALR